MSKLKMKIKERLLDLRILLPTIIIIAIVAIALVYTSLYISSLDDEEVVVEGKIVSVEYIGKTVGPYEGDVLNITFDGGESYIIRNVLEKSRDFTVNSKFIVRLYRDGPASHWTIKSMYRVPD